VWLIPALIAVPYLYPGYVAGSRLTSTLGTIHRLSCFLNFGDNFRQVYFTLLFVLFYLIPLLFISCTCTRIAMKLLSGTTSVQYRQGVQRRQDINRRKVNSRLTKPTFLF